MPEWKKQQYRRWASLTAAIVLLAFCLILLGSHAATAQEPSSPASLEQNEYDLGVGTWHMTEGSPAQPGGVALYGIVYSNQDAPDPATGVEIVDLLPPGTIYLNDTSGLPTDYNEAAGTVTWQVGTLEPGQNVIFWVTLGIEPGIVPPAVIEPNHVEITPTVEDVNLENNQGSSGPLDVIDPVAIDLDVSKNPEPGDPVPGEEFQYQIGWCNNSEVAAGPVTLIDTLPDGVHYQDWYLAQPWQSFWNLLSADDTQVVLEAPSVPGGWCQELFIVLQVDETIEISTTLTNTVEIHVADDVNPENDVQINSDAHVSPPRFDLGIQKGFNAGVLIPTGWAEYGINFWNQGNATANAFLTDTLPPPFVYQPGSTHLNGELVADPVIDGQDLIWDLGPVPVNGGADLSFVVDILPDTPYEEFGNCVTIGHGEDEDTPWDNESCVGVRIWPLGANLHVEKWSEYNYDHINYHFFAANLGSELVPGVVIIDTYPDGTEAAGDPIVPPHLQHKTQVSSAPGEWIFEIIELEPGESGWFDFTVNILDPPAKPAEFRNVITIDSPLFDINPDDNYDEDLIVVPEIDRVELFLEPDGQSSMWGEAVPGEQVRVTTPLGGEFVTTAGIDECPFCWEIQDTGIVNEGDEITVESAAGTMPVVFTVPAPFTAQLDRAAGTVSGQIDHLDTELVEVRGWWEGGWQQTVTDGDGNYEVIYAEPIPPGAEGVTYFETVVNYAQVTFRRHFRDMSLLLQVNYDHDWIQGEYEVGHTVWLTVTKPGQVYTTTLTTDIVPWWERGGFTTDWAEWDPERPNIEPGDVVSASIDSGYTATLTIGQITGWVDPDADRIDGEVHAEWLLPTLLLDVECHPWGAPEGAPNQWSSAGPDGDPPYFCQWDPGSEWDVLPGQDIGVSYYEPFGHQVFGVFSTPWMRVNYGDDWVGGNYPLGYTFVITVTESDGVTEKGIAEAEVTPDGGWGGSGFETHWEDWLGGEPPDIVPGDLVHFATDGYANTVQVGDIGGAVDVGADTVSGPIHAEWFGDILLDVECHPWGGPEETPTKNSSAGSLGAPEYNCDWSGEWDIVPGQEIGVMYIEPDDGDRVINALHEPAPDMSAGKHVVGDNHFAPGGQAVFWIGYHNEGDAAAESAILVDTLPAGATWVADTSSLPVTPGPGTLLWDLGTVAPGEGGGFFLVVELPDPAPELLTNAVEVFTDLDPNPDNNYAEATIQRTEPGYELYVHKEPSPGDPTPGSTYVYYIHYGNNGPVPTGQATLIDLVPNDPAGCTAVVDWYSQNGYDLWSRIGTDPSELVLTAPSLPAQWGDTIILRLKVADACPLDTQLINNVELSAVGADPASHLHEDAHVGEPYTDAHLEKNFGWGTLVPGGEIAYNLHVANHGNLTTTITLNDILPAGTTYAESWSWDGREQLPLTPDLGAGTVSWDLGEIPPGAWLNVELRLDIAPTVAPNDMLNNCAEIVVAEGDVWPVDNTACQADAVRVPGPNLRIYKDYQWNGDGQLQYTIEFQNVGTEPLVDVEIVDTMPDRTSFSGSETDFWGEIFYAPLGPNPRWIIPLLEPGWNSQIRFTADLAEIWLGVQGEAYTNLASADIPDDRWPDDNISEVTAYTGPDLFIEKWLSGGEVRPGEIVTFTVRFGNQNRWPWGTDPEPPDPPNTITDILPDELTFVTATAPWNPDEEWLPDEIVGNTLSWGFGPLHPESWGTFQIVAQVSEDAEAGVIINAVQIHSNSLNDVDPLPDNNSFELELTVVPEHYIYLPLVFRNH